MNRRTLLFVLSLALIFWPARAWAHAHLRRSEPAAGARINGSPRLIRLWFSERPELAMTSVSLTDASGGKIPLGAPENDPTDPLEVSFPVPAVIPPGHYTVQWRTAGSDGHPSRGSFTFTVLGEASPPSPSSAPVPRPGASAGPPVSRKDAAPPAETGNAEQGDAASSVGNSLARALSFVGLIILIGATTFRTLILPRARGFEPILTDRIERRAARVGLAASILVILAALIRISLETEMMNAMPGMQTMSMKDMAMQTRWGLALRLQLTASFVALVSLAFAARRVRGAWLLATIAVIVLAVTPALAGHAAAAPRFTGLAVASDFLHVLAGGSWLGSLFCVMLIGIPIAYTLEETSRWQSIAGLVNAFSRVALVSVAVLVTSGVITSWIHLERLAALWQTTYGRVLLVKLILVVFTLTVGAYNFRRVQPRLVRQEGTMLLRRSAVLELGFGFLILLVTGLLTGISP